MQRQVQCHAAIARTSNVLTPGQVIRQRTVNNAEGPGLGVAGLRETARIAAMHDLSIHCAQQPHRLPRWQTVQALVVKRTPAVSDLAGEAKGAMVARRVQGASVFAPRATVAQPVLALVRPSNSQRQAGHLSLIVAMILHPAGACVYVCVCVCVCVCMCVCVCVCVYMCVNGIILKLIILN
jgi:hypothetical protein